MVNLTFAEISKIIKFDSETCKLFWLHRPSSMFRTSRDACAWNARYSGKEALNVTNNQGYLGGKILSHQYRAHRVIWLLHYGNWPVGCIDHINGIRNDNRIENLRDVTFSENMKNKRMYSNNRSGVVGVCWDKRSTKWSAQIAMGGCITKLGFFDEKGDAIAARKKAELDLGFHVNHGSEFLPTANAIQTQIAMEPV